MIAIQTKYLGPTNNRGSRIKAWTCNGHSITVGYDYSLSDGAEVHSAAAVALARKMGWSGQMISGGTNQGYVFVFADSEAFDVGLSDDDAHLIQVARIAERLAR